MNSMHSVSTNKINGLLRSVEAFTSRYGDEHLVLACHASIPLGLTPELLYGLWAYFQTDVQGQTLNIPWIATADLLLSNLCDEVGPGLYEMNQEIRNNLLNYLKHNDRFGVQRIKEVATFLEVYIQPQLKSDILDVRNFAQAQNWVSVAYLCPEKAAKELGKTLADTFTQESDDLYRIASIVETLKEPLADCPDLITYAQGMAKYAQDDIESARKKFIQIRYSQNLSNVSVKGMPLPYNLLYQEITGFPITVSTCQANNLGSQSISLFLLVMLIFLICLIAL